MNAPSTTAASPVIYTKGTLRYTRPQLYTLFFWLMWNEVTIYFIEQVNYLNGILMRDHGASFTTMAFIGSVGGFISMWINPWFSTWSDRHRGPWGRRRPFLFFATPPFVLLLIAIPFMPDFYNFLMKFPALAPWLTHLPISGPVLFIGVCGFISGLFNAMVLAIFSYLYWDVVPESVMGRFSGLGKIVGGLASFIWSFYIFGLAQNHMKAVYLGVSVICLVIYLLSVWQVKEGEYPPPDIHKKGGLIAPIRAYIVECFSEPYYLWIFLGFTLLQLGNQGNNYQFFYLKEDLHMDMDSIGKMRSIPQIVFMALGFFVGALADGIKPVRLMAPIFFLWGMTNVGSYLFIHDKWSFLLWNGLKDLTLFGQGIIYMAFIAEMFPSEKLGQLCSANQISQSLTCTLASTFIGEFFDHINYKRAGFLWSAIFEFAAALVFIKIYFNWKKRQGQAPVPHAG